VSGVSSSIISSDIHYCPIINELNELHPLEEIRASLSKSQEEADPTRADVVISVIRNVPRSIYCLKMLVAV
jgi:hypothetical protein